MVYLYIFMILQINYFVAMHFAGGCGFSELFLAYNYGVWPTTLNSTTGMTSMVNGSTTTAPMVSTVNPNFTYCNTDPTTQNNNLAVAQCAFYASQIILQVWAEKSYFKLLFKISTVFLVIISAGTCWQWPVCVARVSFSKSFAGSCCWLLWLNYGSCNSWFFFHSSIMYDNFN